MITDRRINVPAPRDLPDGTEVLLTIRTSVADDDGPMSPAEIARVHAAMQILLPLDIPNDVAADLDAWERKVNQYGIENSERGIALTLGNTTVVTMDGDLSAVPGLSVENWAVQP